MFQIVKKNLKIKSKLMNLPSLLKEFKSEIVLILTEELDDMDLTMDFLIDT